MPEISAVEDDNLFPDLTWSQREAALSDGPVLVLAGAGTGKTKTLTSAIVHRIGKRGVDSRRVLAVTFTNKAAQEMRHRISNAIGDGVPPDWVGTFHALSSRMLRTRPDIAGLREKFDVLDAEDSRRILKRVMKGMGYDLGPSKSNQERSSPLRPIEQAIGKFKDNLVTPETAEAFVQRIADSSKSLLEDMDSLWEAVKIYPRYQIQLKESNAADFGDLLLWPTLRMVKDQRFLSHWSGRFDCVFGDEYQDVNYAQYVWLRQLASSHGQIFIVGDDDQAIFGWRGSNVVYIRGFTSDFPTAKTIKLEQNFRSTSLIVEAANAVIEQDPDRLGKRLFTELGVGSKIEQVGFYSPDEEAQQIVREIELRVREGANLNDIAILYRYNFISRSFENALRLARIPYVLVGDVSFWQREEVKDSMAFLRLVSLPHDKQSDEAFRRIINIPTRGIGDKALELIEAEAAKRDISLFDALEHTKLSGNAVKGANNFRECILAAGADNLTLADQISVVLDRVGYRDMLRVSRAEDAETRLKNVQELIVTAQGFATATDLIEFAALGNVRERDSDVGSVHMMTLHRAKGLEFEHIFLPGWEDGLFPDRKKGDLSEERRLAYVALTRGKSRVTISHADFRRGDAGYPSAFIDDIPEHCIHRGWLREDMPAKTVGKPMTMADLDSMRPI